MNRHPLAFAELRAANLERDRYAFGHALDTWSASDWAAATAGELGEALNLLTHARRGEPVERAAIAAELADAVIYLDLLAAKLGIDLGRAVAWKFNTTSQRRGAADRLHPAPETPADPGCRLPADEVDNPAETEARRAARTGMYGLPSGIVLERSTGMLHVTRPKIGSLVRVVLRVVHTNGVTDRESVWLRVTDNLERISLGTLQVTPESTTLLDYGSVVPFALENIEAVTAATTPPRQS